MNGRFPGLNKLIEERYESTIVRNASVNIEGPGLGNSSGIIIPWYNNEKSIDDVNFR